MKKCDCQILYFPELPNTLGVFRHRAVGGENARFGDVDKGHFVPYIPIAVGFIRTQLRILIAFKVRQRHIRVGVLEIVDNAVKVLAAKPAVRHEFQYIAKLRI